MDQLARGRRGEMGTRRKLEAQTAQTKCTSHGVHKRDFWNIPKSVSFLSSLLRFPTCYVSVFLEVGGLGKGASSFSSPCILWAVFEGSWCSSSSEQGGFISPLLFQAVCAVLSARACLWGLPRHVHYDAA